MRVDVPPQAWHRVRVEFQEQRALIRVGKQEPLLVNQLAHNHVAGLVGLWTYLPAYFSNLRVGDDQFDFPSLYPDVVEERASVTVDEWFLEGFGVVDTEPNGILNLNRYLPVSEHEVSLIREVEVRRDGKFNFSVGFSDQLTLKIGDEVIFSGENLYHNSPKWEERGYVQANQSVNHHLSKGIHRITAILKAKEFFGLGVILNIEGDEFSFLPAHLVQ